MHENLNLTFQISSDTTLTSGNIDSTIITVRPHFSYRKMSPRIGPKGCNKVQISADDHGLISDQAFTVEIK